MQLLKSEYYELPSKYNQTMIRLLVQSPTRMFVYWEVSDSTIEYFTKNHFDYSNCTPVLKVTNITMNYSYYIPVDPYANNYYIEVSDSGCRYKVELGRIANRHYITIYSSNEATIPVDHPSYVYDTAGILFGNYLCISDQKRIKVFAQKEQYNNRRYFLNQNHTAFEGKLGSSDIFLRKF